MKLNRDWITPLTIGSFVLVAATGILMFFHLNTGFSKVAHEYLSWVFLGAVALHILVNVRPFKKAFASNKGRSLIAVFVLVLAGSLLPVKNAEHPLAPPIRALGAAPLTEVADIANIDTAELRRRLDTAGVKMTSDKQSLQELVGDDLRAQVKALNSVFDR